MTHYQEELIDKFHTDRLSESEAMEYQSLMNSDPEFQNEALNQEQIIEGLKAYRKAELKARLGAVDVTPGWIELAGQSAWVKTAAGIITAAVLGTAIYLYSEEADTPTSDSPESGGVGVELAENHTYVWELGDLEIPDASARGETPKLKKVKKGVEKQNRTVPEETKYEKSSIEAKKERQVFTPSFEAPIVNDLVVEDSYTSQEIDRIPSVEVGGAEEPIEVRAESSRAKKLKYKYYDGKLFLDGDFSDSTYEILEINSAESRNIYVYYRDQYYQVETTDRMRELPKVEDRNLTHDLEVIRLNK